MDAFGDKFCPFWHFSPFAKKGVDNVDNNPHVIHIDIVHGEASFGGYPQIHNAY